MAIAGSAKLQRTLDATRNTGNSGVSAETWLALLAELTDDELAKYGEIARDQRNLELERPGLQILCGVVALLALAIGISEGVQNGMTVLAVICMALGGVLGFWLFQKSRTRRFWNKHCAAVVNEKTRRAAGKELKVD